MNDDRERRDASSLCTSVATLSKLDVWGRTTESTIHRLIRSVALVGADRKLGERHSTRWLLRLSKRHETVGLDDARHSVRHVSHMLLIGPLAWAELVVAMRRELGCETVSFGMCPGLALAMAERGVLWWCCSCV